MKKFRTIPLIVSGTTLQTDSFILPAGGLLTGVQWAATYACVTNAAYFTCALSTTQFAASADFDSATSSKNSAILSVIRGAVGFATSGLAFEAVNLWVPLACRIAPGGYVYLQCISATNSVSCQVVVHVVE